MSSGRFWFHLLRSSDFHSINGFVIRPNGAQGWAALLAYLVVAVSAPFLVSFHGPFGWALIGGEMLLLLGFACLVLATCDPHEPGRDAD